MNATSQTIELSDWSKLPTDPLVSVYMLAYRHERYIAHAIEGVLSQRCTFPIELIIGDDRSPDGTGAIVRQYQQKYPQTIRILTADVNVGMHANAARCRAAARGQYVAICEGDDYWHHPDKLHMQVGLMSTNPDMAMCHTDYNRQTRFRTWRNRHLTHPSPHLAKGRAYIALLHEWSVMTATSLFRRDVLRDFELTAFNNRRWPFGDRNRLLYASLRGDIGYLPISTATHRKVRNSACNQDMGSTLRMQLATEECIDQFLTYHPLDRTTELNIRARIKQKIYAAAYYANRPDILVDSYAWLERHGYADARHLHLARLAAMRLRFPLRLAAGLKNFVDLHLSALP
jgi:glycosyltransferase involved in cell wall biosynthesis